MGQSSSRLSARLRRALNLAIVMSMVAVLLMTVPGTAFAVAPSVNLDLDNSGGAGPDFSASFTEGGGAVTISDVDADVTDVDDTTLDSATVALSNAQDGTAEELNAGACTGLTVAGSGTATLTITGTGTHATYEACLATATYNHTSQDPTEAPARTVTFVVNDGTVDSTAATATISVIGVNDAPVVTLSGATPAFVEDGGAITVDGGVTITDVDDTLLDKATVTITNVLDGADEVLATTASGGIVAGDISYASGVLTIDPPSDQVLADFEAVLQSVTYDNTATPDPDTTSRVIRLVANDGGVDSANADQVMTVAAAEPSVVSFTSPVSATADETAALYAVELTLATPGGLPLSGEIQVTVSDDLTGTATSGDDYAQFLPTTVTFPALSPDGATMTVHLSVLDDLLAEGDEAVALSVAPLSGLVTIGAMGSHIVTITDNETATVEFVAAGSTALESGGSATVDVVLQVSGGGSIAGPLIVGVDANGDPADYTLATTSLSFLSGSGDGLVKPVSLTLVTGDLLEPDEVVTIELGTPTGPATLGTPSSHALTIVDNVGPDLTAVPGASVVEGSSLGLSVPFVDPNIGDTHSAVIDWGDGTVEAATVGSGSVGGTHTYADDGSFVVGLAIEDSLQVPDATASPVTVTNDAPDFSSFGILDATGTPKLEFKAGEVVAFTGSFVDAGLMDAHTVAVDWGDGTTTSSLLSAGARTFSIEHAYAGPPSSGDRFTARVDIRDDDGGTDALSGPVFVASAHEPDTVGLVNTATGRWHLVMPGGEDASFSFGNPGDVPLVGDWDCDGVDTPGQYRQSNGLAYVRNSNSEGNASAQYVFGIPEDIPLAGDFNGDGCDTISIYRPSEQRVYVINRLGANGAALGPADLSFVFGNPGDKPFVGDFNADGIDTIGLHRETTGLVYYRNSHTAGFADGELVFGDPGDHLVAADWTGDGIDTPGLFRPAQARFYLRFTNSTGNADFDFPLGENLWLPIAGSFA